MTQQPMHPDQHDPSTARAAGDTPDTGSAARTIATGAAAAGAAVGAAALYNAATARKVRPLPPAIPGEHLTFEWRGSRIAYTRLGAGSPVVLVHSIHAAASSYEWRKVATSLAAHHTVYVVDLLGFGRSERPRLRYTSALYVALLDDFARRVVQQPAALVASSLSGAYAIALGARDAARFPALVLVGPTGLTRLNTPNPTGGSVARTIVETPVLGTTLWNLLVSRPSVRRFLKMSYADKGIVTDEFVEAHWQTAHQPGAKHAPASFVGHLLDLDAREPFRRLTQPTFILWGEQAVAAPVDEIRPFMSTRPDFDYVILDPSGDLVHDERPAEFTRLVLEFLERSGFGTKKDATSAESQRVA